MTSSIRSIRHKQSSRVLRRILAAIPLLLAVSASATSLRYKNLDALVAEADAVLVGTVGHVASRYGPDGEIYTFVTLQDLKLIEGTYTRAALTLRFMGGEVAGEITDLIGSPRFTVSERVLLFVRGNGHDIVPIVGWTQGVFRLVEDQPGDIMTYDHEGNRVLGIEGSTVVKDRQHTPAADIVGEAVDSSSPALPEVAHSPAHGDAPRSGEKGQLPPSQRAMRADVFVEVLESKVRTLAPRRRAGSDSLVTVEGFEGIAPSQSEQLLQASDEAFELPLGPPPSAPLNDR
jgi:hypothetical protein